MNIGIDSYCYHRYFGEIYSGLETDPGVRLNMIDVVERVSRAGAKSVSIESFMMPTDASELRRLKDSLDQHEMNGIFSWGHPRGLGSGMLPDAMEDLVAYVNAAEVLGASVMRICAGGRLTRTLSWTEHRELLVPLLRRAVSYAEDRGVTLAVENHIDMSADEMLDLLDAVDNPSLGVCFDTANNLRMLEDPLVAAQKLVPYARAAHVKDVIAYKGSPREFGFWPSVPLGHGVIDLAAMIELFVSAGFDGVLAIETDYLHPRYKDIDAVLAESVAHLRGIVAEARSTRGGY